MKIEFTAWKVTDSHGNETGGIISDYGKSVQVSGMRNADDTKHLHFEDDFGYLIAWCHENKLKYITTFNSVNI